jgi:flagellar protein FliO/FliZ
MQLPVVDAGSTVLTTLGYLCLLLAIIFMAYYLLRRLGVPGMSAQGGAGAPKLIGRLMLGQRQSVVVIRHRDKDLLLGVTEHSITRLDQDVASDEDGEPSPEPRSFASLLKRKLDK